MWYKIPNYSMKCRLYLNETQKKTVDNILVGLRIVHNVTMYEMTKNFVNTKEAEDKKAKAEGETKIIHFPNWGACMKKEWIDQLRANYEIVNGIPSGAIASSVYGVFTDCKKAWEKVGKPPMEFYKPQYYGNKKPRTSYSYQESGGKFTLSPTNDNVIYANLNKLGRAKVRGWNQKIRFGENGDMNFPEWMLLTKTKSYGVTISKDNCGDYYIVFKLSDVWKEIKEPDTLVDVGIDIGIKDIAITSEGDKYENKHFAKQYKRKKKLLNRKCSRRQGWSNEEFRKAHKANTELTTSKRYEKAMADMRKLDRLIARKRDLYNHEVTTDIVRKASLIGVEDLNVKGMMSNHHLAYALSDAAMSDVLSKLSYKSSWYGRKIVQIGRYEPSSQLCSECGYQNPEVKNLNVRSWVCPVCGVHHDRDINAAKNIRNIALSMA